MTPDPTTHAAPAAAPPRTPWSDTSSTGLRQFLRTEAGSAGLLLAATLIALIWANSPWSQSYQDLLDTHLRIELGSVVLDEDLHDWINDALMVFFFYVVGLEVRRELALGELRDKRAAAIPALAALAGMVVPAGLYFAFNAGGQGASGWGIAMATDIAFVVGALAVLGNRVPPGVRVFLLTLAIVDDIGAIMVIAVVYSGTATLSGLGYAALTFAAIIAVKRVTPMWRGPAYVAAGLALWYAVYRSGIHPTIAGVLLGLITDVHPPRRADLERAASVARIFGRDPDPHTGRAAVLELGASIAPNERFQAIIHPWTSYVVIPIFALANAGIVLSGDAITAALSSSITLGVIVGLLVGKTVGIAGFTFLALKLRVGPLPTGMRREHLPGAGALAGIGFTVAIFVAELAFEDDELVDQAKVGVLVASVLAATIGMTLLWLVGRKAAAQAEDGPGPTRLRPAVDARFDRIRGPLDAPHTLTAFLDYECPHSRALAPVLGEVVERAGDQLRLVMRHLPLEAEHPGATLAAEAALSAAALGSFWEMHDRMLAHPIGDDLGPADLLRAAGEVGIDPDRVADDLRHHVRGPAVQADVDSARRSGVAGTPTLFLDGERLDAGYDAESLLARLGLVASNARS